MVSSKKDVNAIGLLRKRQVGLHVKLFGALILFEAIIDAQTFLVVVVIDQARLVLNGKIYRVEAGNDGRCGESNDKPRPELAIPGEGL